MTTAQPARAADHDFPLADIRPRPGGVPRKALQFRLDGDRFAIDILAVREIRSYAKPTRVPGAPVEVRGVMELRGTVLPVVDLGCRLGLSAQTGNGAIVVVDLGGELTGIVVDAVDDVHEVHADQVRPVPPLRAAREAAVVALLPTPDGLVQLLDLAGLLGRQAVTRVH